MDVKLESLIEKIKKDGIEEAKKASQEIIQQAKKEASEIIKEAEKEAAKIREEAQEVAQKLKSNTESSLRQAARDLSLSLKEELKKLFDRLLKGKIGETLTPNFMKELILKMVDKWLAKEEVSLEVLVSKEDKEKLEELLFGELKKEAKNRIEIKVSKAIDRGFRIGIKGDAVHYDFTDESILESLKEFLNPTISAILDANNG